jgi:hypothetical protein
MGMMLLLLLLLFVNLMQIAQCARK